MNQTPPTPPNWQNPEPAGRHKKKHPARLVAALVVGALALFIAIGVAMGGGGGESPEPSGQGGNGQQQEQQERSEADEADDVKRFTLVDKSAYGLTDVRVEYTLVNNSSDRSDYMVDYEVVNKNSDKRVWGSSVYETGVLPGQKATGEDFINVPEGTSGSQYEVNVTQVDRTATP